MRAVIQRVLDATVTINGKIKSSINKGMLILVGFEEADTDADLEWMVHKIVNLRIFDDEKGVMNINIQEANGDYLVVSQFTLYASYKKGNRPSWIRAAKGNISNPLYIKFCQMLHNVSGKEIKTGEFGANMKVNLTNDGPVTICMDSKQPE